MRHEQRRKEGVTDNQKGESPPLDFFFNFKIGEGGKV